MNVCIVKFLYFSLLLDSDGHIAVTDFGLSKENLEDDKVRFIPKATLYYVMSSI